MSWTTLTQGKKSLPRFGRDAWYSQTSGPMQVQSKTTKKLPFKHLRNTIYVINCSTDILKKPKELQIWQNHWSWFDTRHPARLYYSFDENYKFVRLIIKTAFSTLCVASMQFSGRTNFQACSVSLQQHQPQLQNRYSLNIKKPPFLWLSSHCCT